MNKPLRRTRGDLIATAIIAIVSIIAAGLAWFTAPIRSAELSSTGVQPAADDSLAVVPNSLVETLRIADFSPNFAPVIAEGLLITYADGTITATTPTGESVWTYRRNNELCALAEAWGKVVATYRTGAGCSEVVAIEAATGQYAGTRSAIAPDHIVSVDSHNRVGYLSPSRVELWRSDLVRTLEYGHVEAPQESGMQPHQCHITSALTRKELLAVTETCESGSWLRLLRAMPEDSRKPEILFETEISPDAYMVAISADAAAIYDPVDSHVHSFSKDGSDLGSSAAPTLGDSTAWTPAVADLAHHMSYFSQGSLVFFEPGTLAVTGSFPGALGNGVEVAGALLVPTESGLDVTQAGEATTQRVIDVDRGTYHGPVMLGIAGNVVVEKRGDEVVLLAAR